VTQSRILLLTGPVGAGKTTIAERVAGLARQRGIACRGLLAPALRAACGQKAGIVGIDLATGERRTLAHTGRELGGPRLGPYSFDAAALEWATAVILAALASPPPVGAFTSPPPAGASGSPPLAEGTEGGCPRLVIVDEIGTLELWHGQGMAAVLPVLAAGPAGRVLVVVRESLLEELHERLGEVEQRVFRASEQNRDGLPAEIVEALLQAGD
jgi:nucleoside-triphosphatase THEP1